MNLLAAHASPRLRELAWALYDVGTSAFATTVMAGFFPVFFKQYLSAGLSVTESSFWLGLSNSAAGLLALLLAPVIGALSDAAACKKRLLAVCAFIGVTATCGLFWVGGEGWRIALLLYGLGLVGFYVSLTPYDALLPAVAQRLRLERVSALGIGLGYLGGGLLLAGNILMTQKPGWFGFASAEAGVRTAFLTVAVWWLAFTLPLLRVVPEPATRLASGAAAVLVRLRDTFRRLRRLEAASLFLLAYWLYIDGVHAIILMAVDYALALGFDASALMVALLIAQIVGAPATLLYGWLGQRFGAKPGIFAGIGIYALLVIWGYRMTEHWEFYGIAVAIGLLQGGVQALSRALYARLIPSEESGAFFGLFNLIGRFAAILGPLLIGVVSRATDQPRLSILSLLLLFAGGAALLWRVDVHEDGQSRCMGPGNGAEENCGRII